MKGNVLITGGTGLIGSRLTQILRQKGYQVSYLSRSKGDGEVKKYLWNIEKQVLEEEAISTADYIINLAGEDILQKKWSKEFKKEIVKSRTESINLLHEKLRSTAHSVKVFISASGISYYGMDTREKIMNESSPSGNDFLSEVVRKWEDAADRIQDLNIRTVKFRIGIVLSNKGGALEKLLNPIRMGAGAALASGKQYISWIHIDDLCYMFLKALEDERMHGVYNAVAPGPVSNAELTTEVAKKVDKSIHLPNVPAFALKWMLGSEKAELVIGGNNVSADKILRTGFQFKFPQLKDALEDLFAKEKQPD